MSDSRYGCRPPAVLLSSGKSVVRAGVISSFDTQTHVVPGPVTSHGRRIPASPEEVGPGWVNAALWGDSAGGTSTVSEVSSEAIGQGAGLQAQVLRLHLAYKKGPGRGPATLILKLASTDPHVRATAVALGFYEREVRFYRDLAHQVGLMSPKCYWCDFDFETGSFGILLADLGPLASEDELCGISSGRLDTAIGSLADLHNHWWGAPDLQACGWLPRAISADAHGAVESFRQLWPVFLQESGEGLPAATLHLDGDDFADAMHHALDDLACRPWTLAHGSFRLDNLFFTGAPEHVVAIDWQKCSRTVGAFDIAYLLTQSTSVELRRERQWDVLRAWHERLSSKVKNSYSYEDAVADYRLSVLVWLLGPVSWCTLKPPNKRAERLIETRRQRTLSAVSDLGLAELSCT